LKIEESGLGSEKGGYGSNTDLGSFSDVQDQRHNSRQELVTVDLTEGSKGVDDLGPESVRNGTGASQREQTFYHRRQFSVTHGLQGDNLLGVRLGILESLLGHTAVFADGVSLARALLKGVASHTDQMAERQSNGTTEFP